jgi:hypothetical protein
MGQTTRTALLRFALLNAEGLGAARDSRTQIRRFGIGQGPVMG